ncbi:MAG: hypothetical protein H6661_14590, partial [Ardenticatenaceae bacterium]|nr:hypothetical protein [Ardenticatenaceae bacterium]
MSSAPAYRRRLVIGWERPFQYSETAVPRQSKGVPMELLNTAITYISWGLAAYMVGVTLFLAANIAIGAIKTRSALW